jgi:hypothetical protein
MVGVDWKEAAACIVAVEVFVGDEVGVRGVTRTADVTGAEIAA